MQETPVITLFKLYSMLTQDERVSVRERAKFDGKLEDMMHMFSISPIITRTSAQAFLDYLATEQYITRFIKIQ